MSVGGFAAMKALSTRNDDPTHACRPWDKDRDGFVCGEGPESSSSKSWSWPAPAEHTSSPRSSAMACPPTHTT